MSNINRGWKRLLAVGCSHGILIDGTAREAVLKFREAWKPATVFHLGDYADTAAFRTGAKGSNDEAEPVAPDIDAGLDFLDDLGATHVCNGNHEDRIWRLCGHYNAILAGYAAHIRDRICERMKLRKRVFLQEVGCRAWLKLGNYKFGHGYIYNENACRDHAEAHGNVVHAHTHRTGMAKGRRDDNPTGYSVGTLCQIPNMDYAKSRRASLSWSAGFIFGEYNDRRCVLWLHENGQDQEWRLPIV